MWITMVFMWISLSLVYLSLLLIYVFFWQKKNLNKKLISDYKSEDFVTIVIAARNEAPNIKACLQSVFQQNYPQSLYEIILVDDFSEDKTLEIAQALDYENLRVLKLSDYFNTHDEITAHKKTAISIAIGESRGEVILTTDADCIVPPNWIQSIVGYMETEELVFVTGPVSFTPNTTLLQKILALDFCGMMVTTGASVFSGLSNMSNGANLAYKREAFTAVGGFQGIDHVASGDDLLLMEKISRKYGSDKIGFIKSDLASVKTLPPENFNAFVNQRIRWASKSTVYEDPKIKIILILVWLSVLSLVLSGILQFWFPVFQKVFLVQLSIKMLADFILLYTGTRFFKQRQLLWLFLPAQVFHIFYILLIGFLGNFKKYEWKGRVVR